MFQLLLNVILTLTHAASSQQQLDIQKVNKYFIVTVQIDKLTFVIFLFINHFIQITVIISIFYDDIFWRNIIL